MTLAAYAHAGQHGNCEHCGTYRCDPCRHHVHEFCAEEPCQCRDEVHDLSAGETP